MAGTKGFDPRKLIENPESLGKTSDGLQAAAAKRQAVLHRQRVGAARAKLRRATAAGASGEEIAALRSDLQVREARLLRNAAAFGEANVASPQVNSDTAQIIGTVIGRADAPPLTAALIGADGEVLAENPVGANSGFLLEIAGGAEDTLLQVSDANQRVLFRDAERRTLEPGTVRSRKITLTGPIKLPSPAPSSLRMPDLKGQTEEAACAVLFRLGVRDIDVKEKQDTGPEGIVLAQTPRAGDALEPASGATLVVSRRDAAGGDGPGSPDPQPDPERGEMPDFVGMQLREAMRIAAVNQIEVSTVRRPDSAAAGEVLRQDPGPGTTFVPPGAVLLTVSTGQSRPDPEPDGFTMPNLVDQKLEDARRIARELDFKINVRPVQRDGPAGIVLAQNPEAGVIVSRPLTATVQVSAQGGGGVRPIFADRLVREMAQDDKLSNAGVTASELEPMIAKLRITDRRSAERVMSLDNTRLKEAAGLRTAAEARSLRAVMKRALAKME